jgi:hypothetical protein
MFLEFTLNDKLRILSFILSSNRESETIEREVIFASQGKTASMLSPEKDMFLRLFYYL